MRLSLTIVMVLFLAGCTAVGNVRSRMEHAAAPPPGVQQTQFAYIGDVDTDLGTYHVATQRLILTGMLAPRGLPRRLLLFDRHAQLVATYEYESAEPLWCDGSRVYLFGFGRFRGVNVDPRLLSLADPEFSTGNVIDFARGPNAAVLTREKRYGSSGGIDDDPWAAGDSHRPQSTGDARDR